MPFMTLYIHRNFVIGIIGKLFKCGRTHDAEVHRITEVGMQQVVAAEDTGV